MAHNTLSQRLRVAHLSPERKNTFSFAANTEERAAIAEDLGLLGLENFSFEGAVTAEGKREWRLRGRMRARIVQECVITLEPVKTRLDEEVLRIFSPDLAAPDSEEAEMGDDSLEELGQFIDIGDIALETLALSLPPYPRKDGAALPEADAPPAEETETRRPFAGLGDLLKGGKSGD